jgi:hypothetical protein
MNPAQNKAAMQEHIPQWQASHLTQAEYCKAHDIKQHIFSYYKKKFSSTSPPVKQINQLIPVKLVAEETWGDSTGWFVVPASPSTYCRFRFNKQLTYSLFFNEIYFIKQ